LSNKCKVRIYVLADDYAGYNSPFLAQHGLSLLLSIESSNSKKLNILYDTGTYSKPILFNMKLLKIKPSVIDLVVLSHCHYDHTGGLAGLLEKIGKDSVLVIAHPDIFRPHLVLDPMIRHVGVPEKCRREIIEKLGGRIMLIKEPFKLGPGIYYSGEIEVTIEYEKADTRFYTILNGRLVKDYVRDEVSIAISTNKGLVIITGCSHPGIISIINHFQKVTKMNEIRTIIGGLHLINASDEKINKVLKDLDKLNVKELYLGHCTGLKAEARFMEVYGDKFKKLHSGMIIEL